MSHVSYSGSLPLLWSCAPRLAPGARPAAQRPPAAHAPAFSRFAAPLLRRHGRLRLAHVRTSWRRRDALLGTLLHEIIAREQARLMQSGNSGGNGNGRVRNAATGAASTAPATSTVGGAMQPCLELLEVPPWAGGRGGGTSYEARLWRQLEPSVKADCWFQLRIQDGSTCAHVDAPSLPAQLQLQGVAHVHAPVLVVSRQRGALHMSGCEPVDAPMLAQALVGSAVLAEQLEACGACSSGRLPCGAEAEAAAASLWARAAGSVADASAGTLSTLRLCARGARVTRRHAPTRLAISASRWVHALFLDAPKQDALDLVSRAGRDDGSPLHAPPPSLSARCNNYMVLEMGLLLVLWACLQGVVGVGSHVGRALPLVAGAVMLAYALVCGSAYLEQPQLCPRALAPS